MIAHEYHRKPGKAEISRESRPYTSSILAISVFGAVADTELGGTPDLQV